MPKQGTWWTPRWGGPLPPAAGNTQPGSRHKPPGGPWRPPRSPAAAAVTGPCQCRARRIHPTRSGDEHRRRCGDRAVHGASGSAGHGIMHRPQTVSTSPRASNGHNTRPPWKKVSGAPQAQLAPRQVRSARRCTGPTCAKRTRDPCVPRGRPNRPHRAASPALPRAPVGLHRGPYVRDPTSLRKGLHRGRGLEPAPGLTRG